MMGKFDSSKTRVAPVFAALLARRGATMNTKAIPIALLMISSAAGYAQSQWQGSHVGGLPPNSWTMTATNEEGQLIKFLGYPSKEECEKDIPRKEREQNTTYSHCDPRDPPASK